MMIKELNPRYLILHKQTFRYTVLSETVNY